MTKTLILFLLLTITSFGQSILFEDDLPTGYEYFKTSDGEYFKTSDNEYLLVIKTGGMGFLYDTNSKWWASTIELECPRIYYPNLQSIPLTDLIYGGGKSWTAFINKQQERKL